MRTLIVVLMAAIMSFSTLGCGGQKPATEEQPPAELETTPPAPVEEEMPAEDTTGAAVEEHPGAGMESEGAGTE